ncbi:DUF2249 domain-containing protein [Schaalia suimastitidis]|uniref:DUF2249 domain-containing protein n=1 Tax=Schaalia suimastitidis TaxID=121163 RepID=UPI00047DD458|nr:DUF2249 domain-containing protein [Schaalia suimastitidis]
MSDIPTSEQTPRQMFRLVDARVAAQSTPSAGGGCGCGGKGHGQAAPQVDGMPELARPRGGGCGCGGKGHGHSAQQRAAVPSGRSPIEELVVQSIPQVVRHAVLFAAVDHLPVGENLVVVTPGQPDPLFDHLQQSAAHYRVETLQAGPQTWRYRITRMS